MELNTRVLKKPEIIIVDLYGRFDAQETAIVRTELSKAAAKNPHVAVNLDGVKFIDSSGLAALVQGMKRCRKNHGDLYLYNLKQNVRIIFELTRLDKAFSIYTDEDALFKSFR